MTPDIRRPNVIADLIEQGWQESARRVYRSLRLFTALRLVVWVDGAGSVWVRAVRAHSSFQPPMEWVATYSPGVEINQIEDDLLHHLRQMTGTEDRKCG